MLLNDGRVFNADSVILCTGGLSYPTTGSTGDGHRFAADTGHHMIECRPGLVPFEALRELQETDYKKFDYKLLTIFVEHVSLNYVQHEVLLTDGRTGTILMINKTDISRPLVQIDNLFIDLSKKKDMAIEKILM